MDYLNRYSQDFQIKLFQFTPQELKLFFDVHFWLKDETDEKKIEETLRKFYPKHFQENIIVRISDNSASFANNQNFENNDSQQKARDPQQMIETLYQFLQIFDDAQQAKQIITDIIQKITHVEEGDRMKFDLSQYNQVQKQIIITLLERIGVIHIEQDVFGQYSTQDIIKQFIQIVNELIQDLNIVSQKYMYESIKRTNEQQQREQRDRVESQIIAKEKRNIVGYSNGNQQIKNQNNMQLQESYLDDNEEDFLLKQTILDKNLIDQNFRDENIVINKEQNNNYQEKVPQLSEEEKQQITEHTHRLYISFIQPQQFMKLAHLIISKVNNLKEGDTFQLDLQQYSNYKEIINKTLEYIGVFLIENTQYGLFTTLEKFEVFKDVSKDIIKQLNLQTQNDSIQNQNNINYQQKNQQNQMQEEFQFDEQKMLESLYLLIQCFESEQQSIDQIKFLIHKIEHLQQGEKFQLDLSLFSDNKAQSINGVLECIGIYMVLKNVYQLFSNNNIIKDFIILSRELINDLLSTSQKDQDQSNQNKSNQTNDRALLTKLAQNRRQNQRPQDNDNNISFTQQSSREQMEQYRNNKRFTSQNIMTFEKLEQQEEKKYEYMNENPSAAQFPNNKMVTMRDIENMTIAENLQKFGKQALDYTNEFRKQNGLSELQWNNQLCYIGMKHSKDMGDGLVPFGHDGFNNRVRQITFSQRSVAENVAYCSGGYSNIPRTIVNGWINSPGHRKNMLSNSNVCGIAVYRNSSGLWYFTQLFAKKV